ncbi:MAG: hypothetical protein K2X60_06045 [Xanthobacteraceae bacterium]|nr:hypothetical protein [Xanthobacteraceae bacterium]
MLFGWLILLALAIPATAQTAAPSSQMRQACSADMRSLCSGIMPGGGRIKNCMMEKRDQLSQGCKDALASASAQSKDQGKQ